MESKRWLRLTPLAVAALVAGVTTGQPAALAAADRPWDPPPCPSDAGGPPGVGAWYRLDASLDSSGTLTGTRLTVGSAGTASRTLALAPESFASGPVGGLVLAGSDDGTRSELRLVDPADACATAVARESDVIRSAIMAPGGRSIYEHRVDRGSRADLGVWRLDLDAGARGAAAMRVLPGLDVDPAYGPTFLTDLIVGGDGRLVVSSCGIEACRVRVLDPTTGSVMSVDRGGPALGVSGSRLVQRAACAGEPCPIEAVDLATGSRATLLEAAYGSRLAGSWLVAEMAGGLIETVDVSSGRASSPVDAGGVPVRAGSIAQSGAEVAAGGVPLAVGGRPGAGPALGFYPATGTTTLGEAAR
jgi:hypothetical protein